MKIIELIAFLHLSNIKKERESWVHEASTGFTSVTEFDEKKGKIKGWEHIPSDNTVEEKEYSFDDYLLRELSRCIDLAIKEINGLRSDPRNAETVMSNKLFNSTILRNKNKLIERYNRLSDISLNIPRTLEKLDLFIHKQLGKQIIKPRKPFKIKVAKSPGLKLTDENVTEKLTKPLFQWLVLKGMMVKDAESAFLSFFEGEWDLKNAIKWKGKPDELIGLYYSLFNIIDDLEEPIISPKPGYEKLLSFFIVEVGDKRLDRSSLRKYNSNPKQGAFYKKVVSKILELTQ